MSFQLNKPALKEACKRLSVNLLLNEGIRSADIADTFSERLLKRCYFHVSFLRDEKQDPNIVTRAVAYLSYSHALPPFGAIRMDWFEASLATLIDLGKVDNNEAIETKLILSKFKHGLCEFLQTK